MRLGISGPHLPLQLQSQVCSQPKCWSCYPGAIPASPTSLNTTFSTWMAHSQPSEAPLFLNMKTGSPVIFSQGICSFSFKAPFPIRCCIPLVNFKCYEGRNHTEFSSPLGPQSSAWDLASSKFLTHIFNRWVSNKGRKCRRRSEQSSDWESAFSPEEPVHELQCKRYRRARRWFPDFMKQVF